MEFFHPAMMPFTIAIVIMLVILALELVGLMFGAALSDLVDGVLPDFDLDADIDVDVDIDGPEMPDISGAGFVEQLLGWLSVGKVPALMLFVVFLTGFGLTGLVAQNALNNLVGFYLPGFLMSLPALIGGLFITHYVGRGLARIMPKEETDAVSTETFIGQVAEILRGEAKIGAPAEAKLKDIKGMTHYVLVQPDEADAKFEAGEKVLLVEKRGAVFIAIANPNAALLQT